MAHDRFNYRIAAAGLRSHGGHRYRVRVSTFVKRRPSAPLGSVPDVLGMFTAEVRFYREIAPVIGIRVPACYQAEESDEGALLVLEDLSDWEPGADPVAYAQVLRTLHDRWLGEAAERWPWVRRPGAGAGAIAELWRQTWPRIADHPFLSVRVRAAGARLGTVGARQRAGDASVTLCHGDASDQNTRTSSDGEIALLDWEDVTVGRPADELAWYLVSSVEPARWGETLAAYGPIDGLASAWPETVRQGLFDVAADPDGPHVPGWVARLDEAVRRLT